MDHLLVIIPKANILKNNMIITFNKISNVRDNANAKVIVQNANIPEDDIIVII